MAGRDQHDWLLALSSIPQLAPCKDSITNRSMFIFCLTAAADWVPTVGTGFSGLLPVHDRGLIYATRGDYLKGRHWQREAALCGLSPAATLRQVATLCERVRAALDATMDDLVAMDTEARPMGEDCRTEIAQRALFLTNGLREIDPDLKGWIAVHARGAVFRDEEA